MHTARTHAQQQPKQERGERMKPVLFVVCLLSNGSIRRWPAGDPTKTYVRFRLKHGQNKKHVHNDKQRQRVRAGIIYINDFQARVVLELSMPSF
jgi:hypothetical protein